MTDEKILKLQGQIIDLIKDQAELETKYKVLFKTVHGITPDDVDNLQERIKKLEKKVDNPSLGELKGVLQWTEENRSLINSNDKKLSELKKDFIEKNRGINHQVVSDNSKLRERINIDIKKHDKDIVDLREELSELKTLYNLQKVSIQIRKEDIHRNKRELSELKASSASHAEEIKLIQKSGSLLQDELGIAIDVLRTKVRVFRIETIEDGLRDLITDIRDTFWSEKYYPPQYKKYTEMLDKLKGEKCSHDEWEFRDPENIGHEMAYCKRCGYLRDSKPPRHSPKTLIGMMHEDIREFNPSEQDLRELPNDFDEKDDFEYSMKEKEPTEISDSILRFGKKYFKKHNKIIVEKADLEEVFNRLEFMRIFLKNNTQAHWTHIDDKIEKLIVFLREKKCLEES